MVSSDFKSPVSIIMQVRQTPGTIELDSSVVMSVMLDTKISPASTGQLNMLAVASDSSFRDEGRVTDDLQSSANRLTRLVSSTDLTMHSCCNTLGVHMVTPVLQSMWAGGQCG